MRPLGCGGKEVRKPARVKDSSGFATDAPTPVLHHRY